MNNYKIKTLVGVSLLLMSLLSWSNMVPGIEAANATWDAEYWNNTNLTGDPVLQRFEFNLDHNWSHNSPAPGIVNKDNFSARWRRTVYFSGGNYRFTATMDDGMRVWVDNVLIIDSWWDSQVHSMSSDIYLNTGDHSLKVEYYEASSAAIAKLNWTTIDGSAPVPIANWRGEYFNNMNLSGAPALVRDDATINFNWGVGSPAWDVVSSDQFSVRWVRTLTFEPGHYLFTVIVDDGVRLWVNGQLLIDRWHDSNSGTYVAKINVPGGSVPIQMEYYENMGSAVARLSWSKQSSSPSIDWRGDYFNNKDLSDSPVLVRDDANINFKWGDGSPASGIVNVDNFSVRWTGLLTLSPGRYRFTVTADDGVKVWVNNQPIINAWYDHEPRTYSAEIDISGGLIPMKVEYYEHTGGAEIQVSWMQLTVTAVPQPTPIPSPIIDTGIVQSTRLNVRTGPGLHFNVISQLMQGQTVTLTGYRSADGNWVMINWNNSTAWVSGLPAYLWTDVPILSLPVWQGTLPDTGSPTNSMTARAGYCYYLNVRAGPGTTYEVIKAIPSGTEMTLLGRNASATWIQARLKDGMLGWVSANYLIKSLPTASLPIVS